MTPGLLLQVRHGPRAGQAVDATKMVEYTYSTRSRKGIEASGPLKRNRERGLAPQWYPNR
jgi:hypothetical protein